MFRHHQTVGSSLTRKRCPTLSRKLSLFGSIELWQKKKTIYHRCIYFSVARRKLTKSQYISQPLNYYCMHHGSLFVRHHQGNVAGYPPYHAMVRPPIHASVFYIQETAQHWNLIRFVSLIIFFFPFEFTCEMLYLVLFCLQLFCFSTLSG